MEPSVELAKTIYRERVARARLEPIEQKLWDGARLFEDVRERMKLGIRMQHPEASEAEVHELLIQRLRRLREVADKGIYTIVDTSDDE